MKIRFLSVSEVNNYINKSVKADPIMQYVCVYGEVSNVRLSTGGYLFFSLKDSSAKLDCVSFEPDNLNIDIKDGMELELVGQLNFYQRDGNFKLMIREAKTIGIGKAFEQFLELAKKLEKEGLFLSSRKKRIKAIPTSIGIITSLSGAVLQDIKNVASKRYPQCELLIFPARVQGEGTAKMVIDGLEYFNETMEVDTIIIARGGGAYEDLVEFNDESLARAVARSKIPVISAIGHETDNTILDLVADLRASTPSMAAELALPSMKNLESDLDLVLKMLNKEILGKIETCEDKLCNYKNILDAYSPKASILIKEESLSSIGKELRYLIMQRLTEKENLLDKNRQTLSLLNPILPYEKGFAIVKKDGNIINSFTKVKGQDKITISFKDGNVKATIIEEEDYGKKDCN